MRLSLLQIVLATALLAAVGSTLVVVQATGRQINEQVESQLLTRAEVYSNVAMGYAHQAGDTTQIHRLTHAMATHPDVRSVTIFAGKPLRVIASTRTDLLGLAVADLEDGTLREFRLHAELDAQHRLDVEKAAYHYVLPFEANPRKQPVSTSDSGPADQAVVYVNLDCRDTLLRADQQRRSLLLAVLGTAGLLVCLWIAMLVQHALWPLRRLEAAMNARVDGLGAESPPPMPNRDMRQLAASIWSTFDAQKKSDAHMRAIVDGATDAILTIDRTGTIVQFNPGAERMFGIAAGEALGRDMNFLVPAELRGDHDSALVAVNEGRKPQILGFSREVEALRRDGSRFPCSLAVNATRLNGETFYVGILRDRSKEVEAAAALAEAKEQALAGLRTKASFLANVSHEIRTPLTAILGYAEELEHAALTPDQRSEALRVIQRNGTHLTRIVDDILDLSKLETGTLQIQRRTCCPDEILHDVQCIVLPRCRQKGVAFEIRRTEPLPTAIETDPVRLRQILLNLAGNAVKFTDSGSVAIEVAADFAAQTIAFTVIDSGIGIADEQRHLLFQSFSQADNSITRRHGGTGLGLYISQRLARLLGGEITVDSAPGRGSRFCVTIATGPLVANTPSAPQKKVRTDVPPLRGRVLVADDGPDNQRLIAKIVSATGLDVEVVENGAQAVDRVLRGDPTKPIDLVLMDMQMPVMDGPTATEALRKAGYARPIVALTANVLPEDQKRCLDAGCSHFAGKPVDRKSLYALLRETLAANGS